MLLGNPEIGSLGDAVEFSLKGLELARVQDIILGKDNTEYEKFGAEKIVVGIDAKDGLVATKGWVETTEIEAVELAKNLQSMGLRWIIHTDVATDGAMKGPNLEAQKKMADAVPECQVIASGGVTKETDVDDLRSLATDHPNLEGVIIGKALYEGTVHLQNLCSGQ